MENYCAYTMKEKYLRHVKRLNSIGNTPSRAYLCCTSVYDRGHLAAHSWIKGSKYGILQNAVSSFFFEDAYQSLVNMPYFLITVHILYLISILIFFIQVCGPQLVFTYLHPKYIYILYVYDHGRPICSSIGLTGMFTLDLIRNWLLMEKPSGTNKD